MTDVIRVGKNGAESAPHILLVRIQDNAGTLETSYAVPQDVKPGVNHVTQPFHPCVI